MTTNVDEMIAQPYSPISLPPTPIGIAEGFVDEETTDEQTIIATSVSHPIIPVDESDEIVLGAGPDVIVLCDSPLYIVLDDSDDDSDVIYLGDEHYSSTSGDTSGEEYAPSWSDMATDDEDIDL